MNELQKLATQTTANTTQTNTTQTNTTQTNTTLDTAEVPDVCWGMDRSVLDDSNFPCCKLKHSETTASQRCLTHCWLTDEQRDQGQRCLVACWQEACWDCYVASLPSPLVE